MKHRDEYELKPTHYYCVNLKVELYKDLVIMSSGNLNSFFEYLYEKFKSRIMILKIAPIKRTATTQYQPKEEYKKIKLKKIDPTLWKKYWELRLLTGYSISYIVRVFIEWELLDRGKEIETLLPAIKIEDRRLQYYYPDQYQTLNRYSIRHACDSRHRRVYLCYWDDS